MKNASEIISSLQNQPQFYKLVEYSCIKKLKSLLLPSIQNIIKYGYIKNDILYLILSTNINKHDKDNIINIIKAILNLKSRGEFDSFVECSSVEIKDILIKVDLTPKKQIVLYPSHFITIKYKERAKGNIKIEIKDKKLLSIANDILKIIKWHNDTRTKY